MMALILVWMKVVSKIQGKGGIKDEDIMIIEGEGSWVGWMDPYGLV